MLKLNFDSLIKLKITLSVPYCWLVILHSQTFLSNLMDRLHTEKSHFVSDLILCQVIGLYWPVCGWQRLAMVSGAPFAYTSILGAANVLVTTHMRFRSDENGNWRIMAISYGTCSRNKKEIVIQQQTKMLTNTPDNIWATVYSVNFNKKWAHSCVN